MLIEFIIMLSVVLFCVIYTYIYNIYIYCLLTGLLFVCGVGVLFWVLSYFVSFLLVVFCIF